MSSRAVILLSCSLLCSCARPLPPAPPPPKDEFRGFGALRGDSGSGRGASKREEKGEASAAEAGSARGAPEDKADGAGKGLDEKEALALLAEGEKKLFSCLGKRGEPGVYQLQMTVGTDGKITESRPIPTPTRREQPEAYADIPGSIDGGKSLSSATSKCVAKVMGEVRFPPFQGNAVSFTYPIVLDRKAGR